MKEKILATALKLSERAGFRNVTRQAIAAELGIATGTVTYHMGEMRKLQRAVVAAAIEEKNLVVFAQALVERHPLALAAPETLKRQAARSMTA